MQTALQANEGFQGELSMTFDRQIPIGHALKARNLRRLGQRRSVRCASPDYSDRPDRVPCGVDVRANYATTRPATQDAVVLVIETDAVSMISLTRSDVLRLHYVCL